MLTTEGTLALARSVALGAKLAIRGATLCNVSSGMGSVSEVAALTWGDLSSSAVEGATLPCTSYLPSMSDLSGSETGSPIASLDIEFTYMPSSEVQYNVVAVLADLYYAFTPYVLGGDYTVGRTVWYPYGDSTLYFRCIADVEDSTAPVSDTTHWESVTPVGTLDNYDNYYSITSTPVLLYVSKTSATVTVSPEMEIDYKVRLYIDGVSNAESVSDYVVFDTLGPEFMASTQMVLLATFAEQLRNIRDVAVQRAGGS